MKILVVILLFVFLISVVRFALDLEPIQFSDALTILDIEGLNLKNILYEIRSTVSNMLNSFDVGSKLEEIWSNVDITNFLVKLVDSISVFLNILNEVLNAVFVTALNILKFPLQGIIYILRILFWICGLQIAF